MTSLDWTLALVPPEQSLHDALLRMGKSRQHILLVTDADRHLLGTVTDGDVRRAILRKCSLETPVEAIMKRSSITAPVGIEKPSALNLMRKHDIQHLPVIDAERRVVGLIRLEDMLIIAGDRPNWVVLLAGGLGKRLRPLTDPIPKPLLLVGGRPILETILDELSSHGLRHIYLSVNYRAEMVKAHFGDGERFGVEIRYLEEEERLGTAGPLSLIEERHQAPLLVMNGDLLTKLPFDRLLSYHAEHQAKATACVRHFEMEVPYGVVECDGDQITDIVEKPVHTFLVSAGIYVVDPDIPPRLERRPLDMPDLLRGLMKNGDRVAGFPIHEYWIDIGRMGDFSRASADYETIFS